MTPLRQSELFSRWLENYIDYERVKRKDQFSLETMKFLMDRFRHPERAFRTVHVAGSKGKGSVSAMVARILESSGLAAGLYTSPHMVDFTERIGTAAGPFPDELYGRAADIVVPLVESIIPERIPGKAEPTWFELVTLFAFVAFREAGLPWAVIETGLGGRLDATNVVMPEASVITPIELEHTEYLGSTVAAIAGEKAGIIKEGVPVFFSSQFPEARRVIEAAAGKKGCRAFSMDDALRSVSALPSAQGLDVQLSFNRLEGGASFARPLAFRLPMPNPIQAKNAALAAYTAKCLLPELTEETIERGLCRAWLPGRFEIVEAGVPVILDGAHTVRSLELTMETFHSVFPGKGHLLFACAADKDVEAMASVVVPFFSRITLTTPGDRKAGDYPRAEAAFRACTGGTGVILETNESWRDALPLAIRRAREEGIPLLVTGSFYLVTEAKLLLSSRNQDPESEGPRRKA